MAVRTIAELKAKFEAGDKPTQQDFWDLFETMLTLETWPNPLPASSAQNLTNIPIPNPLPPVSGEFLTNINRSDWVEVPSAPTYSTSTSFVVSGDYAGLSYFVPGRRIRIHLNPSGFYFGAVVSATYAIVSNTTTVVVDNVIPTSAIATVDVNLLVDSDIVITSLNPGTGNPLSVYRKNDAGTNVEPWDVPLQAVAATPDSLILRDAAGRAQVADPVGNADIVTKQYADGGAFLWDLRGYYQFPGGRLILQWGFVNAEANVDTTVIFPIAFPNAALWTQVGYSGVSTTGNTASRGLYTNTQLTVRSNGPGVQTITWMAIGH